MKAIILILVLCVASTLASTCLSLPRAASKKQSCGSAGCKLGLYCDKTATCAESVPIGGSCEFNLLSCVQGSFCKGPESSKTCVAYGNPGQDCSESFSDTIPLCGSGLTCNILSKKCIGGVYGDKCTDGKDCVTNTCTNGLCDSPALNSTCSSGTCGPDMYCSGDFFSGYYCAPRLAVGAECPSQESCPVNTVCISKTGSSIPVCTALKSIEVGGYCDKYHELCTSGICDTYCAEKVPEVCTGILCSTDQICTCGSGILSIASQGYGTCSTSKCVKTTNALFDCLFQKCKTYLGASSLVSSSTLDRFTYSGSCYSLNCKSQYDDHLECIDSKYN